MFIALVHAIFHFIMHAWKGRKRAQLEKNEIFIYLKLIHTFPREIFATYVLLLPNGLEENILHKHQKRDCSNHHAPKIIELTELKMCEIF